jgi:glucose-1-phosphatase
MQPNIKNLIFDLGNVIIDLDIERTWIQLKHWLVDDYALTLKNIQADTDIFIQYEIGKISEETFFETLRQTSDTPLSIRHLKEAWNAMLLSIPMHRLEMLSALKARYNVFLLSNTNKTHVDWVDGYLKVMHNMSIEDFNTRYFHKPYYSHLIHLRKPNKNIYEYVLNDAQLIAAETLFIDDMPANTEGAKAVGINTLLLPIGDEIVDYMKPYIGD